MVSESAGKSSNFGWIGGIVGAAVVAGLIGYQVAKNAGDQQVAAISGQLEQVTAKLKGAEGSLKTAESSLKTASADLESLGAELKSVKATAESQTAEIGGLKQKNQEAMQKIENLQSRATSLDASLAAQKQALMEQTGDLQRSTDAVGRLKGEVQKITLQRDMLLAGVVARLKKGADFALDAGSSKKLVDDNVTVRLGYASGKDGTARVYLTNRLSADEAGGVARVEQMSVNDKVSVPVVDNDCYLYLLQAADAQATFKYFCN